jgi:hypothetical protein
MSDLARRRKSLVGACAMLLFGTGAFALQELSPEVLERQEAQFDAVTPKTILELQPFRSESQVAITGGTATLVNLNPDVGAWYLLSVDWGTAGKPREYHLESPHPLSLHLAPAGPGSVKLVGTGTFSCTLPIDSKRGLVDAATTSDLPYTPLCNGALYVRNPVSGHSTSLERATDFLRNHVWGGEKVITFVKREVYQDHFLEKADSVAVAGAVAEPASPSDPRVPLLAPERARRSVVAEHLGLDLVASTNDLSPGRWYAVRDLPAVSVSVIAPEYLDASIRLARWPTVNSLDPVESSALIYLVAFDTQRFAFHYALGTQHPGLGWSDRPPDASHDPRLPGPDGVGSPAPLVTNGIVSPEDVNTTVAAFVGGFKRSHGAFRYGPLALQNHGSHYGFMQQGVIFSKLQPGLASALIMDDGTVDLRTWTAGSRILLPRIRDARQNGVPLIEYDAASQTSAPGKLVNQWGPGNWSGSAGEDLRSLRAGLCLQENGSRQFLIYGYFSAATPSTMARLFQAYHCRYAMHLDMNALEHTYLALYVRRDNQRVVEHLIDEMQVVDKSNKGGEFAPRFLSFPDDRDFFYVTRHEASP